MKSADSRKEGFFNWVFSPSFIFSLQTADGFSTRRLPAQEKIYPDSCSEEFCPSIYLWVLGISLTLGGLITATTAWIGNNDNQN